MEENNQGEENEKKSIDVNEEKKDENNINNINNENQDIDNLSKDNNVNEENQVENYNNNNDENNNQKENKEENNLNNENEINNSDNNKENNAINNPNNDNFEKENKDNTEEIKQNENEIENKNENNTNNIDNPTEFVKQNEELTSINHLEELIKNCNNYKKIIFSNNKLSKISEFFIFKNVSYLDLSNNYFQKLDIFYNLENLQTLLLNNNSIQHLNMSLKYLTNLTHLDLSNNRLDMNDGISIKVLKYNINLRELLLKGNVNYDFKKVKFICLESIQSLIYLDGKRIFGNSRRNRSLQKSFVEFKGKRGNSKKIYRLREYIEFKINDMKDNKKEVEDENNKKDDIIKRFGLDKRSKEKNTSNYYFTYLSSMQKYI